MEAKLREIAGKVCRGEATKEQEAFIVASYLKVFRRPFSKCHCQLCDALFLILKNIDKMDCKFKLKRGIVLTRFGEPYRITHDTLTNENAIEHLTAKPEDAKFFDYIPADVLAKIGKVKVKEIKNILDTLKPEVVRVAPLPIVEKKVEPKPEPKPVEITKVEMIGEEEPKKKRTRRKK